MSDQQSVDVKFEAKDCIDMSCPACGPATHVVRLFVHLRAGRACAACKCGQLIMALGVSREALLQFIGIKLDAGEPSQILRPSIVPPKVRDN